MPKWSFVFLLFAFSFFSGCKDSSRRPAPTPPPPPVTTCSVLPGAEVPQWMWSCWPASMPPSLRPGNPGAVTFTPVLLEPRPPRLQPGNQNSTSNSQFLPMGPRSAPVIGNTCLVYYHIWSGARLACNSRADMITGISCAWKMNSHPSFTQLGGFVAITASISIGDPNDVNHNFVQTGLYTDSDNNFLYADFFVTNSHGISKNPPAFINFPHGDNIETWVEFKEEKNGEFFWEAWAYNQDARRGFYIGTLSLPVPTTINEQEAYVLVDNVVETDLATQLPSASVNQAFVDQAFEAEFGGISGKEAFWLKTDSVDWFTPSYSKAGYASLIFTHDCQASSTDTNEPVNNVVEPLNGQPGKLIFKGGPGVTRTVQPGEFNWKQ